MVRRRRRRKRRDQPSHRTQIMHRAEFVNVRRRQFRCPAPWPRSRRRAAAGRPGRAAAGPVQRFISMPASGRPPAPAPSEIEQHRWRPRTAAPHNLLKLCSRVAVRVPRPDPPPTTDARQGLVGIARRNDRVTFVSRVPNRTPRRAAGIGDRMEECRNRRVYSLVGPDISSSATIGAGLSMRPSFGSR